MKKTLQDQYSLIIEGKGHKGVFLTEAKRQFPNIIRNAATFEEASRALKDKNIISENIVGIRPINAFEPTKKQQYEVDFAKFLEEAKYPEIKAKEVKAKTLKSQEEDEKAELKTTSKQVEVDLKHIYDKVDNKNIDNLIFGQVMKGYYTEMKDPKNADKTMEQLKDIVLKNLAKDPIHYTKDGQFGVKGLGYTTEAPGLGTPKEAKGKYKSSGYGDLNEGQVDMNKSYPKIHNIGTKIEYKGKTGKISGNFMVGGEEFASYKVKFDDGTADEISTADENIKFLEESLEEQKVRKAIRSIVNEELKNNTPEITEEKAIRKFIGGIIRQELNEGVEKELAAINKEAEHEILASKLEKVQALMDKKQAQLGKLDEDEDMKALTDDKKVKEISKDIKALEKAKAKLEKLMSKGKGKGAKKEVIDETEDEDFDVESYESEDEDSYASPNMDDIESGNTY